MAWCTHSGDSFGAVPIQFPITFTSVKIAIGNGYQVSSFFTDNGNIPAKVESLGRIVMGSISISGMSIQNQNTSHYIVIGY